jgi:hypothetical protein
MKKSELKRIIQEEMKGYSKYYPGGETKGGTSDEFGTILRNIALGVPDEDSEEDNTPKDQESIYEGDRKLYSKEEAIDYIKNNPPVKYYKIGVSQGTSQQATSIDNAVEIVRQSPITQFELDTYGQVIQFSAPFDQKHADLVRSMGSLD